MQALAGSWGPARHHQRLASAVAASSWGPLLLLPTTPALLVTLPFSGGGTSCVCVCCGLLPQALQGPWHRVAPPAECPLWPWVRSLPWACWGGVWDSLCALPQEHPCTWWMGH